MSCSIRFLGGALLERDGQRLAGPPSQRHRLALLAVLARAYPRAVPRERLMALLWPERDSRQLLNLSVHVLRHALGSRAIHLQGTTLLLAAPPPTCDVIELAAAARARDHARVVELYGGPFLDGLHVPGAAELDRWIEEERAAFAAEHTRSLGALAGEARLRGDVAGAAALLSRQLAADPYGSRAAVSLAECLDALGDRAAAVLTLERHAARLREEMGVQAPQPVQAQLQRLRGTTLAVPARRRVERDGDSAAFFTARARHFVGKRDAGALRIAIDHFERALAADPYHAPAHAGLADAWSLLGFYDVLAPADAFSRARAAAHRAVTLDPQSADAQASKGYVLLYYHWHWDLAEQAFRRAIALDPGHAQAHQWLGNCLALLGRSAESCAMMRRSRALAPASPIASAAYGWARYFSGDVDHAVDLQLESIALEPTFAVAHLWLGQALAGSGRWTEAIDALRRASALFEHSDPAEAALGRALAAAGDPDAAREIAERLDAQARTGGYAPAYELAKIHAALGDRTRALSWLERAHADRSHSIAFLRVDPEVAALRAEPRGAALMAQVGLGR